MTDRIPLSDDALLASFREGDRRAYEEIYFRYWPIMFRHARKMLHSDEEAKDLIQELFSTFWTDGPTLIVKTTLPAYLYSVLRFKIFNLLDRQKVKSNYLRSLEDFIQKNEYSADHLVRERQLQDLIEREIAGLPEKMRKVFELSRKANLSYREIAHTLDISENTVKKQINNALKILRERLGVAVFLLFF